MRSTKEIKLNEMSNLANVQKLHYCDKKSSNTCTCGNIATWQVDMCGKLNDSEIKLTSESHYRCDEHKNSGTVNRKVYSQLKFDQSFAITKINEFLKSLIGKSIHSTAHTARELEVKFLKDNCGVMCYQPYSKKWKFTYYHQIDKII